MGSVLSSSGSGATQGATPVPVGVNPHVAITMILKEILVQIHPHWSQKVPLNSREQRRSFTHA